MGNPECKYCHGYIEIKINMAADTRVDGIGNFYVASDKKIPVEYGECNNCGMRYSPGEIGGWKVKDEA